MRLTPIIALLATIASYSTGCNFGTTGGGKTVEGGGETAEELQSLRIISGTASRDRHSRAVRVLAKVHNKLSTTVSFVRHPEFLWIDLYADGQVIPVERDGIHFKNPSVRDVRTIEPGSTYEIEAWAVPLRGSTLPGNATARVIMAPPSGSLPRELLEALRKDGALPLTEQIQSQLFKVDQSQ